MLQPPPHTANNSIGLADAHIGTPSSADLTVEADLSWLSCGAGAVSVDLNLCSFSMFSAYSGLEQGILLLTFPQDEWVLTPCLLFCSSSLLFLCHVDLSLL